MILFKSTTNKEHIYKCDRCEATLNIPKDIAYSIYVRATITKNPKKKWDLCKKCYSSLERGIGNNE